ncbi:MAG TPA: RlmE family RNA methyltransferase [Caulobacteraceae bacterium]|nr:RlmE family RNA methyltransferase [Caulobacteraceae bacterium]
MVRAPSRGGASGRGTKTRARRAKTASSKAWIERQLSDEYVRAARAHGYRSRAAFKLAEIDDRFRLIRRGGRVVDLGCAPGGWMQLALERGAAVVVGVDILPVDPLPPATVLQMDVAQDGCAVALAGALGGPADLVLSDMAPNTTGHRSTDHLRIIGLVGLAADFACAVLAPGGAFVAKAFQGGEAAEAIARLKRRFGLVRLVKPKASRVESSELYIVATGFTGLPASP